jgi:hypothetical protein
MALKGIATKIPILVWDFGNNCGKTGQSANLTLLGLGDATEYTPSSPDITEIDTTSRKGEYLISLTAAENNYDVNSVGGNLTTPVADCEVIPTKWVNEQADLVKIAGHSIVGTGTQVADAFESMFNVDKPTFTAKSTNQTADVKTVTDIISASKIAASMDAMSNIDFSAKMTTTLGGLTPTSVGKVTGNVDGSVDSVTKTVDANIVSKVDIDFGTKEKASLNAATPASIQGAVKSVTDPVTITSNSDITAILEDTGTTLDTLIKDIPTNTEFEARTLPSADYVVVGDTISKVTDVVNDVGITQVGADKVWSSISRTLTSFGTLVSDIWANATRTLSGFGTLVSDIWSNITRTLTDKAGFTISGTKTTLDSLSGSDGDTIKTISDQIDNISTSDITAIKNQTDKLNFAGTDVKATLDSETVMLTPAVQAGVTIPTVTDVTNKVNAVVKSIDNGAITADAIGENAIDASALATDAVAEITSAIWAKILDGTITFEKAMKILLNITSTFNMTKSENTYTYRDQAGNVILTMTVGEGSTTSVIG